MSQMLHSVELASERDVVNARQRARSIAELLGYEHHDQIRIATAVSEIARNAFRYARGGRVDFTIDPELRILRVSVTDRGAGIPHLDQVMAGSYRSTTGMGMGILGTKRLMDEFSIAATSRGTTVVFGRFLPAHGSPIDAGQLQKLASRLAQLHPVTPIEELQTQNRELLNTLNELKERREELIRINTELEDTNRGVVALYAELDERADYLRRASELKSSFLSNMSHEFRTPLNSMLALTRMLLTRMDGDLSAEQEQQVLFIQRSAKELAEMVDDLLDLAKVEAGRLEVRVKEFNIEDLFRALRGMLKPLLAENSLHLVFEAAHDLPPLRTDEQKISQILRNFLSNAIKFTAKGEVRVSACVEGENVRFDVADTGMGISAPDRELIFEEFAQVDSAVQRKVKGTGLGLPLSRKLAELLGGTVEVHSEVGLGSTFSLIVPRFFKNDEAPQEPDLTEINPDRKLVLIVEDNSETAFVYTRYLSNVGVQTVVVSSVAEARRVMLQNRPDAIILDMLLEAENSWDFLKELKTSPGAIPVMVISSDHDSRRVFGLGADAYLAKPFDPGEMVSQLLHLVSPAGRPRILIIDDNEVSRYLLRGTIPEEQYDIVEGSGGREGIRLARELKPAVIFLDYYMPDLQGIEVLRDLRASEELGQVPVILHSTKELDTAERALFEEHHVVILPKQTLALADSALRVRELLTRLVPSTQPDESAHG